MAGEGADIPPCSCTDSKEIWNLTDDRDLFDPCGTDGKYDPKVHIAQTIALLGYSPPELLESERKWRNVPRVPFLTDGAGRECVYPKDTWGVPSFNDDGES